MKRVVIVSILLCGIVAACFFSSYKIGQTHDELQAHANAIYAAIEISDKEGIIRRVGELSDYWRKEERVIILFVRHMQIDEITRSVSRLDSFAKYSEIPSLSAELSSIIWQIENIVSSERPHIGNVL